MVQKSIMFLPVFIILSTNLVSPEALPKISINKWAPNDGMDFDQAIDALPLLYYNSTSNIYAVPSSVGGLSLFCNASFPIQWNLHHHQLGSFGAPVRGTSRGMAFISSTRESTDINNSSSFEFQTEFQIFGSNNIMTGNYTCEAIGSPKIATSIYIFWEGSSPPFLTLASMNISVNWNNSSKQAVVPCKVSRPDIDVVLYKVTHNDTIEMKPNKSIVYDATRGFILKDLPYPCGQYKCVANDEPKKDYLLASIIPDPGIQAASDYGNRIMYPAVFKYDANKTQFICCSSKGKPPSMAHTYCEHPNSCQIRKDSMEDIENSGIRLHNYEQGDRCAAIKLLVANSGVIRCIGEGIDLARHYVFPWNTTIFRPRISSLNASQNVPYLAWGDVDRSKMAVIRTSAQGNPMYNKQNYTFACAYSTSYFSHGARWMISWKNKTNVFLEEALFNFTGRQGYRQIFRRNLAMVIVTADKELDSLTCFLPVWNTTEWINNTLKFSVQEPEAPNILGDSLEEIEWYLNDTSKFLSCNFTGKPLPIQKWTRDNKTLNGPNYRKDNVSATVEFPLVTQDIEGDYVCYVTNFNGTASKIFRIIVSVRKGSSSLTKILAGTFISIGIVVLGVFGFILWRRRQNPGMSGPRGTSAFKDVQENGSRDHVTTDAIDAASIQFPSNLNVSNLISNRRSDDDESRFSDGNYHKL